MRGGLYFWFSWKSVFLKHPSVHHLTITSKGISQQNVLMDQSRTKTYKTDPVKSNALWKYLKAAVPSDNALMLQCASKSSWKAVDLLRAKNARLHRIFNSIQGLTVCRHQVVIWRGVKEWSQGGFHAPCLTNVKFPHPGFPWNFPGKFSEFIWKACLWVEISFWSHKYFPEHSTSPAWALRIYQMSNVKAPTSLRHLNVIEPIKTCTLTKKYTSCMCRPRETWLVLA